MKSNEYFTSIFKEKQKLNSRFSMRAASLKTGISPATLSQVINNKTQLTLETAEKLIQDLNFNEFQKETLILLVIKDTIKSDLFKKEIQHKIQAVQSSPTSEDSKKILYLRNSFSKKKTTAYFCKENDRLRVLNTYDGLSMKEYGFSETIVCSREGVTSDVFFISQKESQYAAYVSIHDGSLSYRDQVQFSGNRSIKIEWINEHPQIYSCCMPLIGQKEYALVNISYSDKKIVIEGERFSYSGESVGNEYFVEHSRI